MAWVLAHLYAEQFFNGNDCMFLRADLIFQPDSDSCDLSRVLCQVTVHYVPNIDLIIILLSERMLSLE